MAQGNPREQQQDRGKGHDAVVPERIDQKQGQRQRSQEPPPPQLLQVQGQTDQQVCPPQQRQRVRVVLQRGNPENHQIGQQAEPGAQHRQRLKGQPAVIAQHQKFRAQQGKEKQLHGHKGPGMGADVQDHPEQYGVYGRVPIPNGVMRHRLNHQINTVRRKPARPEVPEDNRLACAQDCQQPPKGQAAVGGPVSGTAEGCQPFQPKEQQINHGDEPDRPQRHIEGPLRGKVHPGISVQEKALAEGRQGGIQRDCRHQGGFAPGPVLFQKAAAQAGGQAQPGARSEQGQEPGRNPVRPDLWGGEEQQVIRCRQTGRKCQPPA